jgi:NAD(P)H dehydrogenase (quinone)
MHILFVVAHPEPDSFTGALLERGKSAAADAGASFEVSDLYAEKFNPVLGRTDFSMIWNPDYFSVQDEQAAAERSDGYAADIAREQDRVARANLIAFLFPLWWGGPPAVVKGWFDRVMSYGFAYVDGARYDRGLFRGRHAMLCIPTGGTAERFSDDGTYGSIERVLWPFKHCALAYTGLSQLEDFIAYATPRVDAQQRAEYLDQWNDHLRLGIKRAEREADPQPIVRHNVPVAPLAFEPDVAIS